MPNGADGEGSGSSGAPRLLFYPDGSSFPIDSVYSKDSAGGYAKRQEPRPHKARYVASKQFRDGTLLEIVEDPDHPGRTIFAVARNGNLSYEDRYEADGQLFLPKSFHLEVPGSIKLPRGMEAYGAPAQLAATIGDYLGAVCPMPKPLQLILASIPMHSWVGDAMPLSPLPVLLGPREFTTPLLRALAMVCRRALIVGQGTPKGVLRACSELGCTLAISDFGLSPRVVRLLTMGTQSDFLVLQEEGVMSPFGPKILASLESPADTELLSNAILVHVPLSPWPDFTKLRDPELMQRAERLQSELLRYRLENLASMRPLAEIRPSGFSRKGWDLVRCLLGPFGGDRQSCAELTEAFKDYTNPAPRLLPVLQKAVISALFLHAHQPGDGPLVKEFAATANSMLGAWGEKLQLSPKRAGLTLRDMGFGARFRDEAGNRVYLERCDIDNLHQLVQYYGIYNPELFSNSAQAGCESCRKFGLVNKAAIREYEELIKPAEEKDKKEDERIYRLMCDAAASGRKGAAAFYGRHLEMKAENRRQSRYKRPLTWGCDADV